MPLQRLALVNLLHAASIAYRAAALPLGSRRRAAVYALHREQPHALKGEGNQERGRHALPGALDVNFLAAFGNLVSSFFFISEEGLS